MRQAVDRERWAEPGHQKTYIRKFDWGWSAKHGQARQIDGDVLWNSSRSGWGKQLWLGEAGTGVEERLLMESRIPYGAAEVGVNAMDFILYGVVAHTVVGTKLCVLGRTYVTCVGELHFTPLVLGCLLYREGFGVDCGLLGGLL